MKIKIYTASRTIHAPKWIQYRNQGYNIISTWIDEAGEGQSSDYSSLAKRCIDESIAADYFLLYSEPGEVLKGALIEAGAALAANKFVYYVGDGSGLSRVFMEHPNWINLNSLEEFFDKVCYAESEVNCRVFEEIV